MSDHTKLTIRDAGESIKETAGKIGNSILDFDLNLIIEFIGYYIVAPGVFILTGWTIVKWIGKDIDNWKSYHIGKKIMHPIVIVLAIIIWMFWLWAFIFNKILT
jgi:hypothetical protein